MSSFLYILQELIKENYFIASIFLYLSIVFLGNIAVFVALWIAVINKIGSLGILGILVLTYLGDVSGDFLWFNLGKLLKGTKIGFFILKHLAHQNNKFENAFLKNGLRWFIISKFFYGAPQIAFSLGWSKYDIKKVMKVSFIASAFWAPILFGLSFGIIFGTLPLKNINFLNNLEWIFFIIGIIGFIFTEILISKLIKKILLPKFQFLNKYFNNGTENNKIENNNKID